MRKVPGEMMQSRARPKCNVEIPDEGIEPKRLKDRGDCWEAGYIAVETQLHGLQRSVRKREQVIDAALKAAN